MAHRQTGHWRTGVVRQVVQVSASTKRVVIDVAGYPSGAHWLAGAHIDLKIPDVTGDPHRSYSIVEDGRAPGAVSIGVRLDPASRGGSAYVHGLKPGDEVTITQPVRAFELTSRRVPCVLVAGGIGVTPIISMARVLKERGQPYQVHVAGSARADAPFLDDLLRDHAGRVEVAISDEGTRLDLDSLVRDLPPDAELYVCGPQRMLAAASAAWAAAGRDPSSLRFETFGNGGTLPTEEFQITIPRLGLAVTVPAASNAVDSLEKAGVEILTDCLRGECGLCVVPVSEVRGRLDHRDVFLSQNQKASSESMALCVSRVFGESVSIDVALRREGDVKPFARSSSDGGSRTSARRENS